MPPADTDTDQLLRSAGPGDEAVRAELLARHRDRLRRMVAIRARLVRALEPLRGLLEQDNNGDHEGRP